MIPILQTKFKEGEGNCLPACLASLLEIPLDLVPEIQYLYDDSEWWSILSTWCLREHNLQMVCISPDDSFQPAGYHIITGQAPSGLYHAQVGLRGHVIHDPLVPFSLDARVLPELSGKQFIIFVSTLL